VLDPRAASLGVFPHQLQKFATGQCRDLVNGVPFALE
jgi:hypothetical protein